MKSSGILTEPVNGLRAVETLIGLVHTTETVEHRIGYETASWYTLVDVPAGSYDVVLHEGGGTPWVLVRYHGIITKEHFVNRLFTSSSVHEPTENVGKERTCTAQMYRYDAARLFATDEAWELAEDWRAVMRTVFRRDCPSRKSYTLVPGVRRLVPEAG